MVKLTKGGMILVGIVVIVLIYIYFAYNRTWSGFQAGIIEPPSATPVGTFTMYYADWCGHCKKIKPEFEEMVKQSPILVGKRTIEIQMVSPEKEPEKAKDVTIEGYPTFYFKNAKTGEQIPYNGERSIDGFKAFLSQVVKSA